AEKAYAAAYKRLDGQRVALRRQEADLNQRLQAAFIANSPDIGTLDSQHQAVLRQLSDLQERILKLEANKPSATPLSTLQAATPLRVDTGGGGLSTPTDPLSRLLLAALIGLALGIGIALFLNRHSEAVYGVPSVEAATMLPVISEVPYVNAM